MQARAGLDEEEEPLSREFRGIEGALLGDEEDCGSPDGCGGEGAESVAAMRGACALAAQWDRRRGWCSPVEDGWEEAELAATWSQRKRKRVGWLSC